MVMLLYIILKNLFFPNLKSANNKVNKKPQYGD